MDFYNSYVRLFIYFPLVLLFLYFILQLLKRFSLSPSPESRIYVVEKVMISPRVLLLVVRVGDEYLLLSAGASGVTLIKELGKNWQKCSGQTCRNTYDAFPDLKGLFSYVKKFLYGKRLKKMKNFEEELDELTRNSTDKKTDNFGEEIFPGKR
ncbi:MAG: FliO/MopB family protein [Firmicutes bacterium]|nr:FliO/MopB family protein [Bacillota bacterium]